MSPASAGKPTIGIPWRTLAEEQNRERRKLDYYFAAVRQGGGEPVAVSLEAQPEELARQLEHIEGFVLPGSPADVEPGRYGAERHSMTVNVDPAREKTDNAVLEHAFAAGKPVLGICFGCQSLNVYLGGSLIQDIRSQRPGAGAHGATDLPAGALKGDLEHQARFETGSRLARLAQHPEARVNSSHHQAIDRPGQGLRVTGRSLDGIVEGVEWMEPTNWVTGVQWHPERMPGDGFAERLFTDFVEAVRARSAAQSAARG